MKLHLPKTLRTAVLACIAVAGGVTTTVGTGILTGGMLTIAFSVPQALAAPTWKGEAGEKTATDWATQGNWELDGATWAGSGPGTPGSNMWELKVDKAVVVKEGLTLEGWAPKITLDNGANITANLVKIQAGGTTGNYISVNNGSHFKGIHNGGHYNGTMALNIGKDSSITFDLSKAGGKPGATTTVNMLDPTAKLTLTSTSAITLTAEFTLSGFSLTDTNNGALTTLNTGITLNNVTIENLKVAPIEGWTLSSEEITAGNKASHQKQYYLKVGADGVVSLIYAATDPSIANISWSSGTEFTWDVGTDMGGTAWTNGALVTFAAGLGDVTATLGGNIMSSGITVEDATNLIIVKGGHVLSCTSYTTEGSGSVTVTDSDGKGILAFSDMQGVALPNFSTTDSTVTLNDSELTASVIVLDGTTLVCGDNGGLGVKYDNDNGKNRTITVNEGGVLENNGCNDPYYHVVLAGGTLSNTKNDISTGSMQFPVIDLTADSTVATHKRFGLLGKGHGATSLDLNGYTLTKTGASSFHLRNTAVSSGTIDIQEGTVEWLAGTVMVERTNIIVNTGTVLDAQIDADRNLHGLTGNGGEVRIAAGRTLNVAEITGTSLTCTGDGNLKVNTILAEEDLTITGDVIAGNLHKLGAGTLTLDSLAITADSSLIMNHDGTIKISALTLEDGATLVYGKEGAKTMGLDLGDTATELKLDLGDVSLEKLAAGLDLGLIYSGNIEDLRTALNLDEDVRLGKSGNRLLLKWSPSTEVRKTWDTAWGYNGLTGAPEELTERDDIDTGTSLYDDAEDISEAILVANGDAVDITGNQDEPMAVVGGVYDIALSANGVTTKVEEGVWISAQGGQYGVLVGGTVNSNWNGGTGYKFEGDSHIMVNDGADKTADDLYMRTVAGGSWGCAQNGNSFKGDTYISVKTNSVGAGVLGGNMVCHGGSSQATHDGDSHVYVYTPLTDTSGSAFRNEYLVVGGSYSFNSATATQNGDTIVHVDLGSYTGGTAFSKTIVGGIAGNANGSLNGAATTIIDAGATSFGRVVGGIHAAGGAYSVDSVKMTINGGDFTSNTAELSSGIYGGAYTTGGGTMTVGDVTIDLKGGSIGKMYAGGYQGGDAIVTTAATTVNVYDTLKVTEDTVISGGYEFGNGKSGSTVAGDRTLNLVTTASKKTFDLSAATVADFDVLNVDKNVTLKLGAARHDKMIGGSMCKYGEGVLEMTNGAGVSIPTLEIAAGTLKLTDSQYAYTGLMGVKVNTGATLDMTTRATLGGNGIASRLTLDDGAILTVNKNGSGIGVNALTLAAGGKITVNLDEGLRNGDEVTLLTGVTSIDNIDFVEDVAVGRLYLEKVTYAKSARQRSANELDLGKIRLVHKDDKLILTMVAYSLFWEGESGGDWSGTNWSEVDGFDTGLTTYPAAAERAVFTSEPGDTTPCTVRISTAVETPEITVEDGAFIFDVEGEGSLKIDNLYVTKEAAETAATFNEDISVTGEVVVEGGAVLGLTGFADAGAPESVTVTGSTIKGTGAEALALSDATISDQSTIDNVSLTNSTISGTTISEGGATIQDSTIKSKLTNNGMLNLGGTITIDRTGFAATDLTEQTVYAPGNAGGTGTETSSGFATEIFTAILATDADNVAWDTEPVWKDTELTDARYEADTTGEALKLKVTSNIQGTEYYVHADGTTVYDAGAAFTNQQGAKLTAFVLDGGDLDLQATPGETVAVKVNSGANINLGDSAELNKSAITGASDTKAIKLTGTGTYDLGDSLELGSGISIGPKADWTGTVAAGSVEVSSATGDVTLTGLTNEESTLAIETLKLSLAANEDGSAGTLSMTTGELQVENLELGTATSELAAKTLGGDSLNIILKDYKVINELSEKGDVAVITLEEAFTGETMHNGVLLEDTVKEYGAKYYNAFYWNDENTELRMGSTANENWLKETLSDQDQNAQSGAAMLDEVFAASQPQQNEPDSDMAKLLNKMDALLAAGDTAGAGNLAAAAAGASIATTGMAFAGDVDRQLRAIRNRTTVMGVNQYVTNEGMPYVNAWINAEGNHNELDGSGNMSGFKLDSWGGTVGVDVDFTTTLTAGMAVTAMYGDFSASGVDSAEGDMDTYYVSAFARIANSAWTHTFVGTFGKADMNLTRSLAGIENEGSTEGMAFGLMYELGYVIPLSEDGSTCLQPIFNVAYRHTSVDGYTEKGGNTALDVDSQAYNTITFGAGARLQTIIGENIYNRASMLEVRALVKLDAGDREGEVETMFAQGGYKGKVKSEELGAVGIELGAGLNIPLGAESGTLFIDGGVEIRSGYTNLNGTVGWRINF